MYELTFDDGPSEWTEPIIDLLAAHGAHATFFLVGENLFKHASLVRRIVADGHTVGNHTFSHPRLTDLDDVNVRLQLDATSTLMGSVCGVRPEVWRAPMFATDERVDAIAVSLGLTHVGADVIPDDWRMADPAEIAAKVIAAPGHVVCLHDGIPAGGGNGTRSRQPTVDAVRLILEARP